MISDEKLLKQFDRHRKEAMSGLREQYNNTEECREFYAGDFMSYRGELDRDKPVIVQFNKVRPYVNAVKGFMAQHRKEAGYSARIADSGDRVAYSEHVESYANYIKENNNADQHETKIDGDMLTVGYGATDMAISYGEGYASTDPNGEILKGRLDPISVWWDPTSTETNLLDRSYCGYRKEYYLDDAMALLDAQEGDLEQSQGAKTNKEYYAEGGPYTSIQSDVDWANQSLNLVNVEFYQWMEYEDFYRADNPVYKMVNPLQAEFAMERMAQIAAMSEEDSLFTMDVNARILDCNAEQKNALKDFFEDDILFENFKRKAFFGAVLSGKKIFTKYRLLTQQGFTIQFKTGDRDEKKGIWIGMVNSMIDPVRYYNRALTELLYTVAAGAKGGVMYEDDAIDNIRQFEADYNKTDSAVKVNAGALSGNKIVPKREAYQPTGLEALLSYADKGMADCNGIDPSFLGSSENKLETAALQRQKIKQVTSVLAIYFDSITLYQKIDARNLLDLIRVQVKANPAVMFRVIGDDGEEDLQQIDVDKFTAEYDILVREAAESATEKEERARIVITMANNLISVGDQTGKLLYAIALNDLPIDSGLKSKVMKALVPDEGEVDPMYVKQLEEMVQELQGQREQAQVRKVVSATMKDMAQVDEIQARTDGERSDIERTDAEIVKILEQAQNLNKETSLMRATT
jgi:hypothetical protein